MKSFRLTVLVRLVAVVILVAGGAAIASNTGSKRHKSYRFPVANCVNCGSNWTSLPFINPYTNVQGLCNQLGLTQTGAVRANVIFLDATEPGEVGPPGTFRQFTCGTAAAGGALAALIRGKGVNIRQPDVASAPRRCTDGSGPCTTTGAACAAGGTCQPAVIIVGSTHSHESFTVPDAIAGGNGQGGNLWFGVPEDTPWVFFSDVCNNVGMTSTGPLRGTVRRLDLGDGTPEQQQFRQASCGTATAGTLRVVPGDLIELREPNGPKTFIPAHG